MIYVEQFHRSSLSLHSWWHPNEGPSYFLVIWLLSLARPLQIYSWYNYFSSLLHAPAPQEKVIPTSLWFFSFDKLCVVWCHPIFLITIAKLCPHTSSSKFLPNASQFRLLEFCISFFIALLCSLNLLSIYVISDPIPFFHALVNLLLYWLHSLRNCSISSFHQYGLVLLFLPFFVLPFIAFFNTFSFSQKLELFGFCDPFAYLMISYSMLLWKLAFFSWISLQFFIFLLLR